MNDHIWTQDNLATFLADGLEAAEKERLLLHVRDCVECATALEAARAFDAGLANLFAGVRPGPTLEDRTVQALRTPKTVATPRNRWARRLTIGLAASLMIGAIAATGSFILANGGLPMPGGGGFALWDGDEKQVMEKPAAPLTFLGGEDDEGKSSRTRRESDANGRGLADANELAMKWNDNYRSFRRSERGEAQLPTPLAEDSVRFGAMNGTRSYYEATHGKDQPLDLTNTDKGLDSVLAPSLPIDRMEESTHEAKGNIRPGNDLAAQIQRSIALGVVATTSAPATAPPVTGSGSPSVSINGNLASGLGGIPGGGPAGPGFGGPAMGIPGGGGTPPLPQLGTYYATPAPQGQPAQPSTSTTHMYFVPKATLDTRDGKELRDKLATMGEADFKSKGESKSGDGWSEGGASAEVKLLAAQAGGQPKAEKPVPTPVVVNPTPAPTAPAEAPARKIIIRSGDIEFEIDSFDSAVATVTLLVTKIKGGYVGTVNSEKLANGKVKGSVVVRVPPESLDGLVLELRKELGKTGELKGQRIGSQDITKMYTDLESRLKAARAMELRLLAIIKDGKGEIKQLLEAEKELGVWRTKIEEHEGELRYYGNLASLSTLTITMSEKDIRVAAGITESERVQAGVEVEDVDKAFRDAMAAVLEAKGRVTRSELKQLSAGQYNAVLNFEVAPDSSGPLRDRLKQLGRVARLEIDRVQTADGGPPVKTAKVTRGDTVFLVQFYNLANVAPRETAVVSIAVNDVVTGFRTLRDAVEKAKGRVITASVNEGDKQNVTAQFDFEVKRSEEATLLAALTAAGDTVSKTVSRAPESDTVTDTKLLFRTSLFNIAKLQPRETTTLHLAVPDIPAGYKTIQDAVEKVKGRVLTAQLHDADRPNITTQLDFEVKRGDEAAVQAAISGAGDTLSRNTVRSPDGTNMTDSKVLLRVTFLNSARMQALETSTISFAVTDIPTGFREIKAAVEKAKGRIVNSNLNEGDKTNVTAQLDFEVKKGEETAIFAMLNGAGDVLSRQTTRVAEAMTVTDTKTLIRMTFVNATRLKPRETTTLALEVADVDATAAVFAAQVAELKGRVVDSSISHERSGRTVGRFVCDVPLASAGGIIEKMRRAGTARVDRMTPDQNATDGKFATARLDVTISNTEQIVPSDGGVWPQVRKGLSYSASALLSSLTWVIFGLCVVLPWMLVGLVGYRVVRRMTRPTAAPVVTPPPTV